MGEWVFLCSSSSSFDKDASKRRGVWTLGRRSVNGVQRSTRKGGVWVSSFFGCFFFFFFVCPVDLSSSTRRFSPDIGEGGERAVEIEEEEVVLDACPPSKVVGGMTAAGGSR